MNSAAADSPQVRRGHDESFFFQDRYCNPAIQGAHGWFVPLAADGKHIGAPEHFHLQFLAVGTEGVKLVCKVANTKIHEAVAVGEAESAGQDWRASPENANAPGAGAPTRAAGRD